MNITAKVTGVDEILRNVRALGNAFSSEVEEKALREAAKPFAEDIRVRIEADHYDTGLTAKDIRIAPSREAREERNAAVLIGAGRRRSFILSFIEFGTFRKPGAHIVAQSFRQNVGGFVEGMAGVLRKTFSKVRAKHLRRAAA